MLHCFWLLVRDLGHVSSWKVALVAVVVMLGGARLQGSAWQGSGDDDW